MRLRIASVIVGVVCLTVALVMLNPWLVLAEVGVGLLLFGLLTEVDGG